MTTPNPYKAALDALERLVYGHNAANMGYEEQRIFYDTIRTALQQSANGREGVTVGIDALQKEVIIELEEFIPMDARARKKKPTAQGAEIGIVMCKVISVLARKYPNGLKIIKGE